ncbi:hypothetical protein AGMMS50293_13210 [Spirochaetia bacterium]|nr:hypothetical protein AGMMS50293_13210 [Spirochaetia bacterium]
MEATKNSENLCSIYCPSCGKVTDMISFTLLREAGRVSVICPECQTPTCLEYDGKTVSVSHYDVYEDIAKGKIQDRKKKA